MSEMIAEGKRLLENFTEEQKYIAFTYLCTIHNPPTPLDDFDYEMAREADLDTCTETVTLEELAKELGFNLENL